MSPHLTHPLSLAALAVMLAFAVAGDIRHHRIANALVLAGAAVALLASLLPGGIGIANAAGGMAGGFAAFLPLYLMRGMGAGDVKLMAAVGAFVGWPGALVAALFVLAASGLLSIAGAIASKNVAAVARNLRTGLYIVAARAADHRLARADEIPLSNQRMPYAVAIAAGTLAYALKELT